MCDCLKSIALFVVFLVSTGIVFRNAKETFIWLREREENDQTDASAERR